MGCNCNGQGCGDHGDDHSCSEEECKCKDNKTESGNYKKTSFTIKNCRDEETKRAVKKILSRFKHLKDISLQSGSASFSHPEGFEIARIKSALKDFGFPVS